jgi:hypothetical protein
MMPIQNKALRKQGLNEQRFLWTGPTQVIYLNMLGETENIFEEIMARSFQIQWKLLKHKFRKFISPNCNKYEVNCTLQSNCI